MNYSHFLITQFNLRNFPLADNNDDYEKWLNWTKERLNLFLKYCLPSVLNQTCKEFIWLLYFDSDTPREVREFIQDLRKYSFINICYSNGVEDFNKNYIKEVRSRTGSSVRWIMTTRIDNDDCLHKDAIITIQKNFIEKHKFLISLASGYILDTERRIMSHYFYPMSPFISLIEDKSIETEGVFAKGHTKWNALRLFIFREIWIEHLNKKARISRFILKNPMWIQTVHGRNVSNNFYRGFPVIKELDLTEFSVGFKNRKQSLRIIGKYYNYVMWKRYFKCMVIRFFLGK